VTSADAFWFGPKERRAFGWFHAPVVPSRAMGIVMCPPLGHEMLCTHRAYRHLAERLAEGGFPVLRFDYHGTGDSSGSDLEDDRVGAWLATIDDAIAIMREAGVASVALFGMRAGGTFAAAAAARRGDVDALALVAPCASGSAFLRELRAMHKLRERGEARPPFRGKREGDEEAIGFVFRKETIDALAKVDLRALDSKPAPRVMIVPRDDLPGMEVRIAERFRALGADVLVKQAPGYASAMSDDPYVAEVPTEIWSAVAEWLDGVSPRTAPQIPARKSGDHVETIGDRIVETALRFGEDERFFGILTEPLGARSDVAIIVPNTGANPRVGVNRFNVTVARRLAERGHAVLRMDLGGIGDSPAATDRGENDLFSDHSIADVRAAIDAAAARGYRHFVTMGLCSGAYMSFHTGLSDPRVGAMVLMNPPAFEWTPGRKVERIANRRAGNVRSTRYYRGRALRVDTWKRLFRGDVHAATIGRVLAQRLRDRASTVVKRTAMRVGRGDWVMSDLAQKFASLVDRGARVLLLFNSEEAMLDELDKNLGGLMPWLTKRGVELETIDDTDHTFAPVWSQERAADVLTEFIDRIAKEKAR
jgi:pimeloyl-ACP methyl ester carboxylesterase